MDYKQTDFSKLGADCFPGLVGIEVLQVTLNFASAKMGAKKSHFAHSGYLHAGSIVTLADIMMLNVNADPGAFASTDQGMIEKYRR